MVLKTKNLNQIRGEKLCKLSAILLSSFLITFIFASIFVPVESSNAITCSSGVTPSGDVCDTDGIGISVTVSGGWTISVASAGTLDLDLTPNSSGVLSTTTDNLHIYTNAPNGYQLYLNSSSGSTDIYNTNDTEKEHNHFTATTGTKSSPVSLSNDTWGYSLDTSPTSFSKVEETSSAEDSLIHTGAKTASEGEDLPITYGFKADTNLLAGTYTTGVTYTAIGEVPSYNITAISPNRPDYNASSTPVTILTSVPKSELSLGNITAKIGTISLTNCNEIVSDNYRAATCNYPGGLSTGRYSIELTSSNHSSTYTLSNAFSVNSMQEFTNDNCKNLPESTASSDNSVDLVDSRDGKIYKISKLADNNCWMVQNLALDGNRTLTPSDSNINTEVILPANISNHEDPDPNTSQIFSGNAEDKNEYGSKYGNLYNWNAVTATFGTTSTTGDMSFSICPRGWQLPNHDSATKSFTNLFKQYSLPTSWASDQAAVTTVQQAPLYFTLSGCYRSNFDFELGKRGDYWTATAGASSWAYTFHFHTTNISGAGADYVFDVNYDTGKSAGYSVRCVLKD